MRANANAGENSVKRVLNFLGRDMVVVYLLAAYKLLGYLPFIGRSEYQRDELLFIGMAEHLDWGYVDDPLWTILLTRLSHLLFGYAEWGMRLFPTLFGALCIILTGLLCRRLGGGWLAQSLAALGILTAPNYIITCINTAVFSYEPVWWSALFLLSTYLVRPGRRSGKITGLLWVLLALSAGLGVFTKITMFWLLGALGLALLISPYRALLKKIQPYLVLLAACLFFLPQLYWWQQHEWCGITYHISIGHGSQVSLPQLLLSWIVFHSWISLPLYLGGLAALIWYKPLRPYRYLGLAFIIISEAVILTRGQCRYISPGLPLLLAAGGVFWEKYSNRHNQGRHWACTYATLMLVIVLTATPYILQPQLFADNRNQGKYVRLVSLGLLSPEQGEGMMENFSLKPQWRPRLETLACVYNRLTEEEKKSAIIFSEDDALLEACQVYGKDLALPPGACNTYSPYYWGLPERPIKTLLTAHVKEQFYRDLTHMFSSQQNYVFPAPLPDLFNLGHDNFRVTVFAHPKEDFRQNWPKLKNMVR